MMTKMVITLLACYFSAASSLYPQDITGEWYGPGIHSGDSSKLLATKDSLIYSSLGKAHPLTNPYAYRIVDIKKKQGRFYFLLTLMNAPRIHIVEKIYPDSCIKVYLDDIVNYDDLLLPLSSRKEFKNKMKRARERKLSGLTISFYKREVFNNFQLFPRFSSLTDSFAKEAVVTSFITFREKVLEKFGYRAFEDSYLAQWIYFDFFVANKLYPFDWFEESMNIRKQRSWLQ